MRMGADVSTADPFSRGPGRVCAKRRYAVRMSELGRPLIVVGLVLLAVGLFLTFGPRIPGLGRLPGDLVWRRGNTTVYFPVVTCIVVSVVLSLLFALFRK